MPGTRLSVVEAITSTSLLDTAGTTQERRERKKVTETKRKGERERERERERESNAVFIMNIMIV